MVVVFPIFERCIDPSADPARPTSGGSSARYEERAMSSKVDEIRSYVCERFADTIGLSAVEFIEPDLSLAEIISRSDKLTNSVDLMEAFAKTANAVKKQYGFRI